jgi:uncharacterized phage protein (TIGR01671 family)
MIREIKFRAFNTIEKQMWSAYELYMNDYTLNLFTGKLQYLDKENFDYENAHATDTLITLDNWVVMQFTGLKDCKGVEIYEGDIVKRGDDVLIVKFGKHSTYTPDFYSSIAYGFYLENIDEDKEECSFYNIFGPDEIEVIGNIHQNLELLEQSK